MAYMVQEQVYWRVGNGIAFYQKQMAPICEPCATPKEIALCNRTRACASCGMTIKHYWRWDRRCCSDRCLKRLARARRQQGGPEKSCAACKVMFKPKRADAEYCSGPCRQWAYRRRAA